MLQNLYTFVETAKTKNSFSISVFAGVPDVPGVPASQTAASRWNTTDVPGVPGVPTSVWLANRPIGTPDFAGTSGVPSPISAAIASEAGTPIDSSLEKIRPKFTEARQSRSLVPPTDCPANEGIFSLWAVPDVPAVAVPDTAADPAMPASRSIVWRVFFEDGRTCTMRDPDCPDAAGALAVARGMMRGVASVRAEGGGFGFGH